MSPKQLATDIRTAYEGRDRDALERALELLERMAGWCPQPPEHSAAQQAAQMHIGLTKEEIATLCSFGPIPSTLSL